MYFNVSAVPSLALCEWPNRPTCLPFLGEKKSASRVCGMLQREVLDAGYSRVGRGHVPCISCVGFELLSAVAKRRADSTSTPSSTRARYAELSELGRASFVTHAGIEKLLSTVKDHGLPQSFSKFLVGRYSGEYVLLLPDLPTKEVHLEKENNLHKLFNVLVCTDRCAGS